MFQVCPRLKCGCQNQQYWLIWGHRNSELWETVLLTIQVIGLRALGVLITFILWRDHFTNEKTAAERGVEEEGLGCGL